MLPPGALQGANSAQWRALLQKHAQAQQAMPAEGERPPSRQQQRQQQLIKPPPEKRLQDVAKAAKVMLQGKRRDEAKPSRIKVIW